MNLSVLKKSRRAIEPGDVFAMLPPDGAFLFGRVIAGDASVGPMTGLVLIYLYSVRSDTKDPPLSELTPDRLLVPPIVTNRLPWSKGYFQRVASAPLRDADKLEHHCFRDFLTGKCFDEHSHEVAETAGPVGVFAVSSYRTIDDKISRALGIPLAPDD